MITLFITMKLEIDVNVNVTVQACISSGLKSSRTCNNESAIANDHLCQSETAI